MEVSLIAAAGVVWLTALFAYTGSLKLGDRRATQLIAAAIPFLPRKAARLGAGALGWMELAVAAGLCVAPFRLPAAIASAGFGVVFLVISARHARDNTDCGCAGSLGRDRFGALTIARATVITATSVLIATTSVPEASAVLAAGAFAIGVTPRLALATQHRGHAHVHANVAVSEVRLVVPQPGLLATLDAASTGAIPATR